MELPEVETTPILLLRFTSKSSKQLIDLVAERFQDEGLIVDRVNEKNGESSSVILTLTTTQEHLEEQAELGHYMFLNVQSNVTECFEVKKRHRFCDRSKPHCDKYGLFQASDWLALTTRLFNGVTVLRSGQTENKLSNLLKDEYHANYLLSDFDEIGLEKISHSERWADHGERSDYLRHVLEIYGLVDTITPLHLPAMRREITLQTTLAPWYSINPPVENIKAYYGWEIGLYFAWMGFLTRWLFFPGVLGLFIYILRIYRNDTIDTDEYTPFYGLVCFFWAVLFLRFWEREEHRLSYHWGTFPLTAYERQKYFAKRIDFRGFVRVSPVTGELETYFPSFRRRPRYLVSAAVTLVMLAVAFSIMILSLNLQGYIRPQSNPSRWHDKNKHPFHFPSFAILAEEGQIFDSKSEWRVYIPTVLHVACIFTLNNIYRLVAEKLTNYENHETERSHEHSLILKRFLFEAFDCYVALFYLAFYERDVVRLRSELATVFQIDTLRRFLLECVVPVILLWLKLGRVWLPSNKNTVEEFRPSVEEIVREADMGAYEQFDDMMEICIQLGYVTLFASAYPLASLVSILANWVEVRSDAFKLAFCQRPMANRSSGLGVWKGLFASVIWTSALTNCLIAGFTSDQLVYYLPTFYIGEATGYREMGHDKGWVLVFVMFGLERLLLVSGLLVYNAIPEVAEDILECIERRQFIQSKAAEETKREERRRSSIKKAK
ncbi:hypothetical protein ACA910_011084 [Epithemia clementina (nom. ined.)]